MTAKYLLLLLDNKLAEFVSTCLTIVQFDYYAEFLVSFLLSKILLLISSQMILYVFYLIFLISLLHKLHFYFIIFL